MVIGAKCGLDAAQLQELLMASAAEQLHAADAAGLYAAPELRAGVHD